MRWSWRLADIAGTRFCLHATLLPLFLWVALYGPLSMTRTQFLLYTREVAHGLLLQVLLGGNLFLGGFNLSPGLPMDGGIARGK